MTLREYFERLDATTWLQRQQAGSHAPRGPISHEEYTDEQEWLKQFTARAGWRWEE